jgi:hypothetical protein
MRLSAPMPQARIGEAAAPGRMHGHGKPLPDLRSIFPAHDSGLATAASGHICFRLDEWLRR